MDTKLVRFAVETKLVRFAVLTYPPRGVIVEIYPAVPRPMTVEPICVAKYDVLTKFVRLAVDTIFDKLALFTVTIPVPPAGERVIFVPAII